VIGPPYVKLGETFTYDITVCACSAGTVPATDVVLNTNINGGTMVSVSSSQGRCRKSVNTDDVVVCELGTMQPLSSAVVSITIKAEDHMMVDRNSEELFVTTNTVACGEADSWPENNIYESRSTLIRH
jgi:Domain of unknown function DUF11